VYGLKIRGKQCKVNNSIVTVTSPGTTDKHTKTAEVCNELRNEHIVINMDVLQKTGLI